MIISWFGVKLERLTETDLELVRNWRNSPEISQNMAYREYITPEMQKDWFHSINNINNFYYIIKYRGKKIGLVNSKNLNWEERTCEGGIFIWDKKYTDSFVPLLATLCIIESGFYFLNWKKVFVHVLKNNASAIYMADKLGYKICEEQESEENLKYYLTRENYITKAGNLRKAVRKVYSEDPLFSTLLAPIDYATGIGEKIESELLSSHPEFKIKNTAKGKYFFLHVKDF
jgi:UDP-4-amino-4,6-dideoxy-N-acetyl-beta-L-altrosamine N-acetyltransferase